MAVTYNMFIQTFLQVDEDSKGLYVEVPGYDASETFKVRCEENGTCPQVTHCRCSKFSHKGTCDHSQAVQMFWARIYKTNIQKAQEKQVRQAILEAETSLSTGEVAIAEQVSTTESVRHFESKILAPQIVAPKIIKLDGQSKRTASFFSGLPSRRVA